MTLERLHKVLASAGAGSRRECEQFIVAGRVTVDGQVVRELGTKVDPEVSEIRLDFEVVKVPGRVYYMVNKPRGVISSTRDDMGRPGVVDLVPGTSRRVYPVGRLDADSVGLVLLTNDGELAQKLTHPSFEIRKTYDVRARGSVSDDTLEQLKKGIWLSDGRARVEGATVRRRRRTVTDLVITLHEGKNREIRRVMAKVGHPVLELRRTSIGTLELGTLKEGRSRKLTAPEVQALKRLADTATARTKQGKRKTSHRRTTGGRGGPSRRSRRG